MVKIKPQSSRSSIIDDPRGIKIIIPSRKNIFLILFLAAWLVGWAMGEFTVPRTFFAKDTPMEAVLFTVAWLTAWTVGGVLAVYTWLWNIAGKEIITFREAHLTTKKDLFGFGRTKEYELAHVRNMRVAPTSFNPWNFTSALEFWGIGGGAIAFDYGARTFRFGAIEEAEANQIVQTIRARYPLESEPSKIFGIAK